MRLNVFITEKCTVEQETYSYLLRIHKCTYIIMFKFNIITYENFISVERRKHPVLQSENRQSLSWGAIFINIQ